MDSIAGVVVLYYPDIDQVSKNVSSYIDHISRLLVIDNTPAPDPALAQKLEVFGNSIEFRNNIDNEGMARSLNKAASWAIENNFQWLLTMDQDSSFSQDAIFAYINWVKDHAKPEMAVVGLSYGPEESLITNEQIVVSELKKVITSGSIINLNIWNILRGFDEKLFIDEVDHEYCYHAVSMGFKVYLLQNIFLFHNMGNRVNSGYFGGISKRNRMIHSPLRIYYMIRNYCYVRKKYQGNFPEEMEARDNDILNILKNNLFFSGQFFKTLKMAIRGYLDYRKGIFGKYS